MGCTPAQPENIIIPKAIRLKKTSLPTDLPENI
jgi:hypothetical protein